MYSFPQRVGCHDVNAGRRHGGCVTAITGRAETGGIGKRRRHGIVVGDSDRVAGRLRLPKIFRLT